MSQGKLEKFAKMANQIGDAHAALPSEEAARGVANHIRKFWTPKMIEETLTAISQEKIRLNATSAGAGWLFCAKNLKALAEALFLKRGNVMTAVTAPGCGARRLARQGRHDRETRFQPMARAPGGARHPPLHRHVLRPQRVLAAAQQGDRRPDSGRMQGHVDLGRPDDHDLQLARQRSRRHLRDRHRRARPLRRAVRRLAGARRPAQGGPRGRVLLGRGLPRGRARRLPAPALDDLGVPRRRSAASAWGSATSRRSPPWSNGSRTGAAWRPAWRSWASAAAR